MRNVFFAAAFALIAPAAQAVTLSNFVFSPVSPATLPFYSNLEFTFDYVIEATDPDVRIFGRPFSLGALRIDYGAHGSFTYASGSSGTGSGFLTIVDTGIGSAHVDQVRFQAVSWLDSSVLYETFAPVDVTFGTPVPVGATLPMLASALLGAAAVLRLRR